MPCNFKYLIDIFHAFKVGQVGYECSSLISCSTTTPWQLQRATKIT